jgi:hypothetical protein
MRLHFKHLSSALGEAFTLGNLALPDLQAYVAKRAKARGPGLYRASAAAHTERGGAVMASILQDRFPVGMLTFRYDVNKTCKPSEKPVCRQS